MKCKWNKFSHIINLSKTTAIYNSLSQNIIYINKEKYRDMCYEYKKSDSFDIDKSNIFNKELLEDEFIVPIDYDYKENISKLISISNEEDSRVDIIYFVPTTRCNLLCGYCHIKNEVYTEDDMDIETVDLAIEKIKEINKNSIDSPIEFLFYGGEPTLRFDILKYIVKKGKENFKNISFTIFTNATVITDEIARFFKEEKVFSIVSIDGTKESNDRSRNYRNGNSSYKDVINGYHKLVKHNITPGISMVMGTHNIDNLEENVEYIIDEFKPADIGLSTLHMQYSGVNPYDVDIEYVTDKMVNVFKLARNKKVYIEHLFRRIRPIIEHKVRIADCPSCGSKLLITPKKTITFCEAFMQDPKCTFSINEFDLKTNEEYNKWKSRTPLRIDSCHSCISLGVCGGGCPYDAYKRNNSILSMDEVRCKQSIILTKWCIEEIYENLDMPQDKDYIKPSNDDRKKIYGEINFKNIPLQNYSKNKETSTK